MDTNRLKRFATEARNKLMQGVAHRLMALGFRPDGSAPEEPQLQGGGATFMGGIVSEDFYQKWNSLHHAVQMRSIDEIVEEAAYTWFNRLVAIRIIVKNGLIPPVLEYESEGVHVPLLVSEARQGRMPHMDDDNHRKLLAILDDDSKTAEQFALLIVAFCHDTPIINRCFGKIADYTELLLPQNILGDGGFVSMLNDTSFIDDEDYKSPELIGWLYQYYISEKHLDVYNAFKRGEKAEAKDIPAATQIFTPNWIVKYMVQNSIGRIYLDNNPDYDEIKEKWQYLVEPVEPTPDDSILHYGSLEELTVADLACGSGHILNECFDLLFDLYMAEGYSRSAAVENIFKENLTGIDIDTRAKQLAQFALLLKACQKDVSFADAHIMPRVFDMPNVDRYTWRDLSSHMECALQISPKSDKIYQEIDDAFKLMEQANNLGSIMKFDISPETRDFIKECVYIQSIQRKFEDNFTSLFHGLEIILALTDHYSAMIANPPYLGSNKMNIELASYLDNNYNCSRQDLYSTFIYIMANNIKKNGKAAFITMESWMFLSSFEDLRAFLLENNSIESLIHMPYLGKGWTPLGINFGNSACVISGYKDTIGTYQYIRYYETDPTKHIPFQFPTVNERFSKAKQSQFYEIRGKLIGYWLSDKSQVILKQDKSLKDYALPKQGLATGDNDRFLRFTWEPDRKKVGKCKWVICTKGGRFRKWYGNLEYCVNWENDGYEIKHNFNSKGKLASRPQNSSFYFKQVGVTWSTLTNNDPSFRYFDSHWLFETKGSVCFPIDIDDNKILLGYLNSPLVNYFLKLFTPTIDYHEGPIGKLPFYEIKEIDRRQIIDSLVADCIDISKSDWNAHETSWDFKENELLRTFKEESELSGEQKAFHLIDVLLEYYKNHWEECFERLHANEEELNRQFIDIYGLQDELAPNVPLGKITILQQGEISIDNGEVVWHADVVMKQLISYAVGCMMGRYSIDKPGLILANQGDGLKEYEAQVPNSRFEVDDDGIIPLMPSDTWFNDNATLRFKRFVATVFGEESLNENLNFIEQSLGKNIDNYFVKDFWKDHKKMYQNRPIYWLFSSKKGAFQCLVYMHRMNAYTAERIRSKYLLPHIEWLVQKAQELESAPTLSTPERKQLDNLHKQIDECREYHDRLHTIADRQIDFDLDDGVVVNYAKFGDILAKLK